MATKRVSQEEFAKQRQENQSDVLVLLQKMNINRGQLGCVVLGKKTVEGKEKLDTDGSPIIDDRGQIERYPDSYYVEISNISTGKFNVKVEKEMYDKLEVGENYFFTYSLEVMQRVSTSKAGNEYVSTSINVKPIHFEKIFDYVSVVE